MNPQGLRVLRSFLAAMLLLACAVLGVSAGQEEMYEQDLTAQARLFPGTGPGLRAIRRDLVGRYYILTAPGTAILIYSSDGKQLGQIPSNTVRDTRIADAVDFDVDGKGRVYVADAGGNAVEIYSSDGKPLAKVPVGSPTSVAALSEGQFAVATPDSKHLIEVFDANGRKLREFGEPTHLADRTSLDQLVNTGRLRSDFSNQIYYAFTYFPEPTVRRYDATGTLSTEMSLTAIEYGPAAQAARREISRQDERTSPPRLKPVISAFGVDPRSHEVWIALGDQLVEVDKDGDRRAVYRTYTKEGARVVPVSILAEAAHIIVAADPLGIYEYAYPKHAADAVSPSMM
jgi:hypothetical protein